MERRQSLLGRHRRDLMHGLGVFTIMLGLALGCGSNTSPDNAPVVPRDGITEVAAEVAQVAAAITGQPSLVADEARDGRHLGFDTSVYPGDRTMYAWKHAPNAPYRWVGYYLVSPCHKDASWRGKRALLVNMGWGLAAVYVGQQTWGRVPRPTPARQALLRRAGKSCNADFVAANRGIEDGFDAVHQSLREGFPLHSVIFLDIERMERMPESMRDYYRLWARALLQDGRYVPGVYVHAHNAAVVYADLKQEFAAARLPDEPRIWVASGRGFSEGKAPHEVGFRFAGMWQGMIDVARAVGSIRLPVDVNVSNWISPSQPAAVGN